MSSRLRFIISTVFVLALVVGASSALADWTAPLSNPPTCTAGNPGCDAPVNVSANDQYKAGGLAVGGVVGGVAHFLNSVSDFIVGGPSSNVSIIRTDTTAGSDYKYLDIYGAGPAGGFVSPSTRGAHIRLSGNQATFGASPLGGQIILDAGNNPTSSYISLTTNGAEKMRINNNGSVGVGVASLATSPNAIKFGVNGNVGAAKYCDLLGTVCASISDLINNTNTGGNTGTNFWQRKPGTDVLGNSVNYLSPATTTDVVSLGESVSTQNQTSGSRLHVKGGQGLAGIDTTSLATFGPAYIGTPGNPLGSSLTVGNIGAVSPGQFQVAVSGNVSDGTKGLPVNTQIPLYIADNPANFNANLGAMAQGKMPTIGAGGMIGALGNGGIFFSSYDSKYPSDPNANEAAPGALGAFTSGSGTTGLLVESYGASRYGVKVLGGQAGIYSRGKIGIFATDNAGAAGESNDPNRLGQMLDNTATPRFLNAINGSNNYAGYFLGNVVVGGTIVAAADASYTNPPYSDVCRTYRDSYPSGQIHYECIKDLWAKVMGNSDATLKHNIATISQGLDKVLKLRGVTFDWNDPARGSGQQFGVIAQEVEKVVPSLVSVGEGGVKSVSYNGIVGLLIEAVKSQQKQIDAQQAQIDQLKAQIGSK